MITIYGEQCSIDQKRIRDVSELTDTLKGCSRQSLMTTPVN